MVLFGLCGVGLFSAVLHIIIQGSTTLCYPYQVQVDTRVSETMLSISHAFLKEWTWADTGFTICI